MARKKRPSLVAEIGRLLVEYPEKDWRALVNRLRERALIEDIAAGDRRRISVGRETGRENEESASPTRRRRDCESRPR